MGSALRIEGTYTALVTPFTADGAIDWAAFDALVDAQVAGGVQGIVPCGTTGESPSLTHEEHAALIVRSVERAKGRVQVIAGTGSNSTREAVAMSKGAEKAGVSAVMVVVPYYNKPTQEGLYRHFVEVASAVSCPVVIYNVPARTGSDLSAETLARICEKASNVTATKEATGNVLRAQTLACMLGTRLTVLSGDDALALPMIAVGARGVISVTSNLLPAEVSRATALALEGKYDEARRAHLALVPVHEAMFLESNPGPVKVALAMRGVMTDVVRGPLAPVTDATKKALAKTLETYARAGGDRGATT
jgi:4-hydroxy-tetrahydrodipicolinate synthase